MDRDRISVIVPAYEAENTIEKCIKSIQSQSYQNLQIIIVDDGSEDQTASIVKRMAREDQRILLISQENQGVSGARNKGIQYAEGAWVLFVDSDDVIQPDLCEVLFRETLDNPCDLVVGGLTFVKSFERSETKLSKAVYDKKSLLDHFEIQGNTVIYQNVVCKLYRSTYLKKCQFPVGVRLGEDMLLNYQYYAYVDSVAVIPYYGYEYLAHQNSATRNFCEEDFEKQFLLREKGIEFYQDILGGMGIPAVIEQNFVGNMLGIILTLVSNCSNRKCRLYLKQYLGDKRLASKLETYTPVNKKFSILKQLCLKKRVTMLILLGKINRLRCRFALK